MRTSLRGIADKARRESRHRFQNLSGLLSEGFLRECWCLLNKRASAGVDGVSAQTYGKQLEENLARLVGRLKRGSYRARLVRRKEIPKSGGKTRPLGIPVVEDKLVQTAAAKTLGAIWEQEFLPCSYGYRPGRSARDAVRDLTQELQFGCYGYVVEVDIRGFFEHIDHDWMVRMLEERIDDRRYVRLIQKWLRAGVLTEDGQVFDPTTGCPQGGVISPVLANIYLHYVLDLWFERRVKRWCRMRAAMFRYADDVVFAFQSGEDARAFFRAVRVRLVKFHLAASKEKSRIVRFSRFHLGKSSESFEFLGFEFRWMPDRSGVARVRRRTARARLRASLQRVAGWCREMRSQSLREIFAALNRKLVGYYGYYGVIGNWESLRRFYNGTLRILRKWLARRSERGRMSWRRLQALRCSTIRSNVPGSRNSADASWSSPRAEGGSENDRRARCGKTARRDPCGVRWVTDGATATACSAPTSPSKT
jgi:group II intron reverse transcriptase/maturase